MCVGGDGKALIAAIRKNRADSLFGIGKGFLLGVTFGHYLGKRRDQYREAAAFLRLKHN